MTDESDETRDRVILAIEILEEAERRCPCDPSENDEKDDADEATSDENKEFAAFFFMTKLPCSFDNLERRLHAYINTPGAMESNEALTLSTLPIVEG